MRPIESDKVTQISRYKENTSVDRFNIGYLLWHIIASMDAKLLKQCVVFGHT